MGGDLCLQQKPCPSGAMVGKQIVKMSHTLQHLFLLTTPSESVIRACLPDAPPVFDSSNNVFVEIIGNSQIENTLYVYVFVNDLIFLLCWNVHNSKRGMADIRSLTTPSLSLSISLSPSLLAGRGVFRDSV